MNSTNPILEIASHTNHYVAGVFRRTSPVLAVGVFVISAALLSGPAISPGLADETPGPITGSAANQGPIDLTCNEVRVSSDGEMYSLVFYFTDTSSGADSKALIGPFTGTFGDRFGRTDIVFTEVRKLVDGEVVASERLQMECR